jgi:hypothetical protein
MFQLNVNGYITFDSSIGDWYPNAFPLRHTMIAVYFSDVILKCWSHLTGDLYYRITNGMWRCVLMLCFLILTRHNICIGVSRVSVESNCYEQSHDCGKLTLVLPMYFEHLQMF